MMPSFTSSLPGQALVHLGGHVARRGRRPGNLTHSSAGPPLHHSPSLGPTTCTLLSAPATLSRSSFLAARRPQWNGLGRPVRVVRNCTSLRCQGVAPRVPPFFHHINEFPWRSTLEIGYGQRRNQIGRASCRERV